MKKFLSLYVGDKKFYSMLLKVCLPIIIQNAISQFVNLLDNIMVGQTGTDPMTGVSVSNQLIFVFNIIIFGSVAGAGIFCAQFFGKNDQNGVRYTMRFKLIICTVVGVLGMIVFWLFKEPLLGLYMQGGEGVVDPAQVMEYGKSYVNVMLFGLLPFAISQAYSSTLLETGETFLPMISGVVAVGVNLVGNYILIFGHFGAPALGVVGAAIATVASRYVEMGILIVYAHTHTEKHPFVKDLYKSLYIPSGIVKNIAIKGTPLLLNETLWSLGIAAVAQCYSTRGLDVVSATNISNTIQNLFNVVFLSLGNAVSIIVGQALGAGETEKAVDLDRKLIFSSIVSAIVMGAGLCAVAPLFPELYNTEPQIKQLATQLIIVVGSVMPLHSICNACYFTLRAGGKTVLTFFFDSVAIWALNYTTAFLLINYAPHMSVPMIMFCEQSTNLLRCVLGLWLVHKRIWVKNLVTEN